MSTHADLLTRFSDAPSAAPLFVPDLTLWYHTHQQRGTLPELWRDASLPQIAAALGVPAWMAARPWRIETPGVDVEQTEEAGERLTRIRTSAGELTTRWTLGSDGTWWQMEYPVKSVADLPAALELAQARTYVLEAPVLSAGADTGNDRSVAAVEIPTRPYADLLYDMVGMGEGFMLLMESPPEIDAILAVLEEKLQSFIAELTALPATVLYSPDNLDAQFIPPSTFSRHLAPSYRRTTEQAHQAGKHLLVHAGGPVSGLLEPLAEAGVDGVEGVAPPPQSDVSLAAARQLTGPRFTLWGGIPQDYVLATRSRQEFEATVIQAAQEAGDDSRIILGIADRVPVDVEWERLEAIPALMRQARG